MYRDIAQIDTELYAMAARNPELAEVYRRLMGGEELGEVVALPRAPTVEDWEAAKKLAAGHDEGQGQEDY